MKILITGGFGYIGGRLAQFLSINTNYEIFLGSRKELYSPEWLKQVNVVQTMWNSQIELERICKSIDIIIHLAGMNAQDCALNPAAAFEVNAVATAHLMQAAISQGVNRFVYLSTAHIYCNPLVGEISEECCPKNKHPYAASHRAGEDVIIAAHERGDIESVVIRLSNSFGAPAHKKANCWMLLVNDLCRQAVATGEMVLRSSGLQYRDFISLTDSCRAIEHLFLLPSRLLNDGVFNVGGAWSLTIYEMTQKISDRVYTSTGLRPKIRRPKSIENKKYNCLDYKIDKLIGSGFLNNEDSVDEELDNLIEFCSIHFHDE